MDCVTICLLSGASLGAIAFLVMMISTLSVKIKTKSNKVLAFFHATITTLVFLFIVGGFFFRSITSYFNNDIVRARAILALAIIVFPLMAIFFRALRRDLKRKEVK